MLINIPQVRRVHWLRARASAERWREECLLIRHEMRWTVTYFEYKSRQWSDALMSFAEMSRGPAAYADRKATMWMDMAVFAKKLFIANDPDNFST